MAFGDEGPGNSGGAASGEGNLLTEGQLREARDDLVLGNALEFHGNGRRKSELYEIHEVNVANQT